MRINRIGESTRVPDQESRPRTYCGRKFSLPVAPGLETDGDPDAESKEHEEESETTAWVEAHEQVGFVSVAVPQFSMTEAEEFDRAKERRFTRRTAKPTEALAPRGSAPVRRKA